MSLTAPDVRESTVLRSVEVYLKAASIFFVRMNSGSLRDRTGRPVRFGSPGMADILAIPWIPICSCREPVWIECKSSFGKQSEQQKLFQRIVESYGHTYLLVRSAAEVEQWMHRHRASAKA